MSTDIRVRVAHLHSSPAVYGAEWWTLTMLRYLDPARLDVTIVNLDHGRPDCFEEQVRSTEIPASYIGLAQGTSWETMIALRRLLKARQIDVIHSHGYKADTLGFLATAAASIARVSTLHGWCGHDDPKVRVHERLSQFVLRRLDRVYPVSSTLHQDALRIGVPPNRIRPIRNAVDLERFDSGYRDRHRRSEEPFTVLYVGRLVRSKGIDTLIAAYNEASFPRSSVLTIAGDGPDRDRLVGLCPPRPSMRPVCFVGRVSTVNELLSHADVLVLPSASEGLPRVVMEAFAAGCPVIASDIPGIRELVTDGETGLLVSVGDVEQLKRALERIARSRLLAAELATRARGVIVGDYDARDRADRLTQEYQELRQIKSIGNEK